MKIISKRVFEGKNIYSHKKCLRVDLDLEGYCETPSKDIPNFNFNLTRILPELYKHRCGIDEEHGFVKRLKEGTYLAHICEHCIIAIQNMLDIEVSYGKAREVEGDHYYIIVQYEYEQTALRIVDLVVDLINSLISQKSINFDERILIIKDMLKYESDGPSTRAIIDAAKEMGLPVIKYSNSGIYQIGYGRAARVIEATIGSNTSCVAADISCDKLLTKKLLKYQCIPVAEGYKVNNIIELIKYSKELGYPLVLKPQYGNKGKGVILNIKSEKHLIEAFNKIKKNYKDVILEEFIKGKDYRVLVVRDKVIAVALRIPPYITGNGEDTILNLIKKLNADNNRGDDHEKPLTKVKIDEEVMGCISKEGLSLESVLEKDRKIYLRENANISTGGVAIDCTDIISQENKELCVRVAKTIGLDICGIDLCTSDIMEPIESQGVVMEVNTAPGIRMHCYPYEGNARNVGKEIINMLYNDNPRNIPLISVTGTNGKTTTTRIISYIYSLIGYNVGMTSTDGIFLGEKCLHSGDDTGVQSAKTILMNKDVDIAVLETARGGIVKKGLAYDLADVGVITNITEDHLGLDGINTLEELAFVKSVVAEEVKENGYAVINADDSWSLKVLPRIKSKIVFFSHDKENPYIKNAFLKDNIAVYIDEDRLMAFNNGRHYNICSVSDIGISMNGRLKYNISNAMAATAALISQGVDYCIIAKGLKEFKNNEKLNKGRFNEYDINGVKVILDYGHNLDGYRVVLESLKTMEHNKLIGVIGIPGDRSDDVAERIGEIAGENLDYIFIKEDKDRRGREKGDICNSISKGIEKKVKDNKKSKIVLDEVEALKEALDIALSGDVVIVFYEKFKPLVDYINNLKERELRVGELNSLEEGLINLT
ncbi:cyanophycin synthetase [Clostridium sp. 'White wine YQ']|uniref:cyanophycin synthetase n=1 Tax=Clostridium sp. 'White wine YQ' TaxID=3027474 RepID=UPI0023650D72|nr:cyanophycin synthetase [Clostridium sp. 'White wine YQ']MDD7792674.1 cyanophycin synthetase [Clostridium sp. 'White wine YQ']